MVAASPWALMTSAQTGPRLHLVASMTTDAVSDDMRLICGYAVPSHARPTAADGSPEIVA